MMILSRKIEKILSVIILLSVSLFVVGNSMNICNHKQIDDHENINHKYIDDICNGGEQDQSCNNCVDVTTDTRSRSVINNVLSKISKKLLAAPNYLSYFTYLYSQNNVYHLLCPVVGQLFPQYNLFKSIILRL
jgi:hypothetical protein